MAHLDFYAGTMNSSKTAQLLMVRHNYLEQGKNVLIFKPAKDTRDLGIIKSRALEVEVKAITITDGIKRGMYYLTKAVKPDCVLVDEVQFMPTHQIEELGEIVDLLGIPVIAYGLLTDFQTNLFEGSRRLIEIGARVKEIKTVCWDCNTKAMHNMRLHNGEPIFHGEQVQVGGNESYRPVCRACYNKAKQANGNK